MSLESYNYFLPQELIAQAGAEPRDSSRLMVVHRDTGTIEHRVFRDISEYLRPGDVLVLNQSKVIPARLYAHKRTGARIEVLLVRELTPPPSAPPLQAEGGGGVYWEVLLRHAHKTHPGTELIFTDGLIATVEGVEEDGTRVLRFSENVWEHLERLGETPLPPYIYASVDPERYQTVYAKTPGSVAAPTAGLHFTPELLDRIRAMGVDICYVTLHVGPGTFKPVKDDPDKHQMHAEPYEIGPETAETINRAKAEGRRVIAVGTTVVRTLESAVTSAEGGVGVRAGAAQTQLFIRPGFTFGLVDVLITNFHLPKSTLLMLVSAFAGYELTMHAYTTAVEESYRFYSLGDAMLIV
ncbi:MAG: tRNA preQ1(34) S-adenosylmethionine ribosyltransferase-isomerase QueA [Thermaceae bacterium]|nr:tRNA preQ1(34) S-adenosylmethionine ribosyltransferase-isomerase QueA [Thermaceae bacterium]